MCDCGEIGGDYVRCSLYFCLCGDVGGVVLGCMVYDFGLDKS